MSIRGYSFVFALMKCSYAAFGEQNKTDNDSKCQQVYKSLFLVDTSDSSQLKPTFLPTSFNKIKKYDIFFLTSSI